MGTWVFGSSPLLPRFRPEVHRRERWQGHFDGVLGFVPGHGLAFEPAGVADVRARIMGGVRVENLLVIAARGHDETVVLARGRIAETLE